jgi:transcriptional regulator with XRE-family HTH domain
MQQHHPILELFGKNVQRLRIEQNISQEKLAEKAHLHRTYIGMVERAERNITLINMQKIATALGVSMKSLFEPQDDVEGFIRIRDNVYQFNSRAELDRLLNNCESSNK